MQSTHVEVVFNLPRDEGSTPSASKFTPGQSPDCPAFFFLQNATIRKIPRTVEPPTACRESRYFLNAHAAMLSA